MMHSKKKSVKLRFRSSAKKTETKIKKNQILQANAASNYESKDNDEINSQIQSVLDLLPGTDTNLIKVLYNHL